VLVDLYFEKDKTWIFYLTHDLEDLPKNKRRFGGAFREFKYLRKPKKNKTQGYTVISYYKLFKWVVLVNVIRILTMFSCLVRSKYFSKTKKLRKYRLKKVLLGRTNLIRCRILVKRMRSIAVTTKNNSTITVTKLKTNILLFLNNRSNEGIANFNKVFNKSIVNNIYYNKLMIALYNGIKKIISIFYLNVHIFNKNLVFPKKKN
jgi:hypothetical protein